MGLHYQAAVKITHKKTHGSRTYAYTVVESAHWNSPLFKLVTNLMEYSETNWMGSQFLLGGSLSSDSFMMNAAKETAVRRTQGQGKGEELSVIAEQPKNMPTETVTVHRSVSRAVQL